MMPTSPSSRIVLVTGPTKSGKSEWAETLAMQSRKSVIYIATAQTNADDPEWQQRISQHRDRRPADWLTVEAPENLTETIATAPSCCCLLVDSLGTWVANLLEQDSITWAATEQNLILSLERLDNKDVIVVAEEATWGVVPAYSSGRLFRDRLGQLVRRLGAIANPVYLIVGGHVLNLSLLGSPLPTPLNEKR